MLKRIILGIALLTLIFAVACSSTTTTDPSVSTSPKTSSTTKTAQTPNQEKPAPGPKKVSAPKPPEGRIKATWIDPVIKGDKVYISVSDIEKNWNVGFKVGKMNFMSYVYKGEIYVRANVCPPCRSIGFSLVDDKLVCDTCATVFKAKTGAGVQGACVDFPKASVIYTTDGDNLVMTESDLSAAYQDTMTPG